MPDTALGGTLGLNVRLYVGNTLTPANDAAYTRVTNENKVSFTAQAKTTEQEMKENGGQIAVLTGPISYEIKIEGADVYVDTGYPLIKANLNKAWPFQLRETIAGVEKVAVQGSFVIESYEESSEATGSRTMSVSLKGAGAITINATPRALL